MERLLSSENSSQDIPTNYLNKIIIPEQWFQTKKKHKVPWKCFPPKL